MRAAEPSVQELVETAMSKFEVKKFDDAQALIDKALAIAPDSAMLLNLRGAVLTKKDDFVGAKEMFEKSLSADPSFFPARFNIGETLFLQKQYPQALDYFRKLLDSYPQSEILQFKLVLCLLLTDQPGEAEKLASRMRRVTQDPSWYFAQAALEIKKGNKGKARSFIISADALFPGKGRLYTETFDDLGWPSK